MSLCWNLSDAFLLVRLELNTETCYQGIMDGWYSFLLASASVKLESDVCGKSQAQFEKAWLEEMKSTVLGVALSSPCPLHHFIIHEEAEALSH